MSVFQSFSILFALAMMYVVTIHKKKSRISATEVSFWLSVWTLFIVIAMFPQWLLGIAGILQFGRVFDMLIVLALMFLTVLIISSYFSIKETNKKIEDLVRSQAIADGKRKK